MNHNLNKSNPVNEEMLVETTKRIKEIQSVFISLHNRIAEDSGYNEQIKLNYMAMKDISRSSLELNIRMNIMFAERLGLYNQNYSIPLNDEVLDILEMKEVVEFIMSGGKLQ